MRKIIICLCLVMLMVFAFSPTIVHADPHTKGGTEVKANGEENEVPEYLENQDVVSCGNLSNIPEYIPFITSLTITILTIISMGMLVVMGTIDLFKGINSGKPDEMKKCQKAFYSRIGSAVFLFFIVALTKLLVSFFLSMSGGSNNIIDCIGCFINNSCR